MPGGPGGNLHRFSGGGLRFPTGVNISRITKNVVTRHSAMATSVALAG